MGTSNYSHEFKRYAVHQITVRGYADREVYGRLGVSTHSLYKWIKLFGTPEAQPPGVDHEAKNRRLKRELARVTEERDLGEQVSENRVARLASLAGILAQVGYKRRLGRYGGESPRPE